VILTLADRDPVAVGVNVTVIVHLLCGGKLLPQLFVCEKSLGSAPLIAICVMESELGARLLRVTLIGKLEVPTFTSPKLIAVGESMTAVPVPDSVTCCGLPVALSVTESVPFTIPLSVGVNVTWISQFASTAKVDGQLFV